MRKPLSALFAVLIAFGLLGCVPSSGSGCADTCGTPLVGIDEFSRHGVTFADNYKAIPESIDIQQIEDANDTSVYSIPMDLYILPAPGETDLRSLLPFTARELYRVYPSKNPGTPQEDLYTEPAYRDLITDTFKKELLISSNFTIHAEGSILIPIDHTHLEIWHREDTDREFQLLRRVELRELWVWRKFVLNEDI